MDQIFRITLAGLSHIPELPTVVYARGNLKLLEQPGVAIVGSRKPTEMGIRIAQEEVDKVREGQTVISGLAVGIDTVVHEAALVQHKPTIAVLPLGVGDASVFPVQNRSLAARILSQGGLLLSIYKEGDIAHLEARYFLERNAVIAALATKVIGIEAKERSGTISTLRRAVKFGRETYVNYQGENGLQLYKSEIDTEKLPLA